MKKILCFLMILCTLLTCTSCINRSIMTTNIDNYRKILEKVHPSSVFMPEEEDLGNYSALKISSTTKWEFWYRTQTVALFLDYKEMDYETQKSNILKIYTFYEEGDAGLTSDHDASVDGYEIRLVGGLFDEETQKHGLCIGFDDAKHRICYLFYEDPDLDVLDNLEEYITQYFNLP